jgi:hypothetical protein
MSDIGDESIGDREEIWTRIEELRQEEVSFCEAREVGTRKGNPKRTLEVSRPSKQIVRRKTPTIPFFE